MSVRNVQEAFLFDLSMAYAGERAAAEIVDRCAREVADDRARMLLGLHAEEIRAQMKGIEQMFTMLRAQPQNVRCPVVEGVREEIEQFRQQDPAPEFVAATMLFGTVKISHGAMDTFGLLVDKAMLMGEIDAALMLTTICKQKEDTAGMAHRLMHEILLECTGETSGALTELAAAGGARTMAGTSA
ncbi:DUF892 family protein [Actinoplanes teichomyceticus]|uniref:Ferritin-like metal-binding protein YciE n=1 Tax=Actinoplanes teichomyceticus TaxID=1867 RepID=A0A561VIR4_ACTTI|nr:DUF892 family protein [Actinoplanes teichomyceticus]TWG11503.1 ferritin-like metal-binding protein YciE [Actinoplanes teichomyceticus]GIF15683.1 hypothetical protein Ate01nite_57150 [Actinoplanes teichomyceticus]